MNLQPDEIQAVLQPSMVLLGYECLGVEVVAGQGWPRICIYIDLPNGGISMEQISKANHPVLDALRLAGINTEQVHLEISSPGLNRRLFTLAQCAPFIGQTLAIRLRQPIAERGRYKGVLTGIEGEDLLIKPQDAEQIVPCPWQWVVKANVVPDLSAYLTAEKSKR